MSMERKGQEEQTKDSDVSISRTDSTPELSSLQQDAFDALNTLQVSTDEKNRLYSTFAGNTHACYPPDTTVTISQSEFLIAIKQFVKDNCTNLDAEKANELASKAVLAQEAYKIALCQQNSSQGSFKDGIPTKGTWIIANILGRRDVVIIW